MTRGLFERVRELQHAPVVAVRPDDLESHGQSAGVKPAGTEIAGFAMNVTYQHDAHPVDVGRHRRAGDLVGYGTFTSKGATCVTGSTK